MDIISTVAISPIIHKTRQCGLFEKISYGNLLDDLSYARKKAVAPSGLHIDLSF